MKKNKQLFLILMMSLLLASCTIGSNSNKHEHTAKENFAITETHHYHECTYVGCKEQLEFEEHQFDDGIQKVIDGKNYIVYTCSVCEYFYEQEYQEMQHGAKNVYSYDETYHYYECVVDDCTEVFEKAKHTFGEGVLTEIDGIDYLLYTCLSCEYSYKEEANIPHTHTPVGTKQHDATHHYDVCSCGETFNKETHQMGEWIITEEATEDKVGSQYKKCSGCDYQITQSIPKLEHVHIAVGDWIKATTEHYHICKCGQTLDRGSHTFDEGVVTIPATPDNTGELTYTCSSCGYTKTEEIPQLVINSLTINAYNTQAATEGFNQNEGIELFKKGTNIGSSLYWHKVLLKQVGSGYQVVDVIEQGVALTGDYDYVLLSYMNESTGNYQKLVYYLNELDYVTFNADLSTLSAGSVNITLYKTENVNEFKVEYDLGYEQYDTKDDLYEAYFKEFYYFLGTYTDCHLEGLGIYSVEDFLTACKTWRFNGGNEMAGLGNAFGRYYLDINVGGTFEDQSTNKFVGYCYQNGKFIDLLEHLEVFFAYWRTDEGYTNSTNNGNDFFASAWAALVDTCKFFYFTSETITNTYSWFTYERSPRVHYMLDNIPGVGTVDLVETSNTTIILPELTRMHHAFLGWFDESGNEVETVSSTSKVTAKWLRYTYKVTFNNGSQKETYNVLAGLRTPVPSFSVAGYKVAYYVDKNNQVFDIWNAINEYKDLYVVWEPLNLDLGSITICGFNTEEAVSVADKYHGIRIYKSGVGIDSSLYWYKIAINYVNGQYVVSGIAESGDATPSGYDFLILAWNSDSTGGVGSMRELGIQVGNIVTFSADLNTLSTGEVNLTASFTAGKEAYNVILVSNGADVCNYNQLVTKDNTFTLPVPIKNGYKFMGWYDNPSFTGTAYSSFVPTANTMLYAKWEMLVMDEALDYVSDIVTSDTIDNLPASFDGQNVTYTSSDNNLYTIKDGKGYTNREYQKHWSETVTVYATLEDGTMTEKEITINPVTYDVMEHPKSVYFAVGSASSYKKYNERYLTDGTLFSDKFKENMDMLYYAFAIPQEDGTLTINSTYIKEVMELKNHGVRVLLVIDGANNAPLKAMVKLCNDETTRAKFVQNILDIVVEYNFDGVDVDWEFPGILSSTSGYEQYTTDVDIKNLNSLLKELREGFNNLQEDGGSNYILSVATPPTDWGTDRFDYATINKYCDYVNMMSYDLNKTGSASHLTHVYAPDNSYSYRFCCDFGVSYYTSLGLDKSKIILGCAAYGKAYKITGTSPNSLYPGLGATATLGQVTGYNLPGQSITWNSGTIYYTGIKQLMETGKFTEYHEYNSSGKFVGSYLYNATDNYFITYDSVLSVQEKCKYALANEGMGVMVWAYGEDATDTIINTICDNLK